MFALTPSITILLLL